MRVLIQDLPEKEITYIKRNCSKQIETGELTLVSQEEFKTEGKQVELIIAEDEELLQRAVDDEVAAIAYQRPGDKMCSIPVDIVVEGFEEVDYQFFYRILQRKKVEPWTILETERLLVRELTLSDVDDLFELYSYEGMTDYMEGLYPYEEEYAYQKAYIENMYGFFGYGMWLVFEKKSGKLIGRAGVEHREALDGELELGYAIGTPWQGMGYATEVCLGILTYVKEELGFDKIVSLVEPENKASVHLLQKIGFVERQELLLDGIIYKKFEKSLESLIKSHKDND